MYGRLDQYIVLKFSAGFMEIVSVLCHLLVIAIECLGWVKIRVFYHKQTTKTQISLSIWAV